MIRMITGCKQAITVALAIVVMPTPVKKVRKCTKRKTPASTEPPSCLLVSFLNSSRWKTSEKKIKTGIAKDNR